MHALPRPVYLAILPLLMMLSPAVSAETLNAEQVKTLFSDKTVEYRHEKLGFEFVVYHAPDGTLRGTRDGQLMSELQWSVNEHGELCIAYNRNQRCYPIMRDDGKYKKYTVDDNGKRKILLTYRRFIDGNPNDF
ncbi:hypothetical protein [Thiohalophilus sp.]|uniref:hypothetical protein n=1 Tax=Thiohalophilus sp. TaxID=3028392 RepID=UPI002ACD2BFF|nr:hypothetical protein [Thiohalophilus sp.]MDZ7803654.1 hypothetical protein [Thiohalophilus sp.]